MTEDVFLDGDMRKGSEVLLVAGIPQVFESVPAPTRPTAILSVGLGSQS